MVEKISVLVATYNRKQKVERLIASLMEQTYANWELILIDDGSSDGTKAYVESLTDPRIIYKHFSENRGHPVAFFDADIISLISGEYITHIGSDSYFLPHAFETIIEKFAKERSEVWRLGFAGQDEKEKERFEEIFSSYPDRAEYFSREVVLDNYPQIDMLFAYKKQYWDAFKAYYTSPNKFFIAFFEVALNNQYIEVQYNKPISVVGWSADCLSKGYNAGIYFRWYLEQKRYLLEHYSHLMGAGFKKNVEVSYLRSLAATKGKRLQQLSGSWGLIKTALRDLVKGVQCFALGCFPASLARTLKLLWFKARRNRA